MNRHLIAFCLGVLPCSLSFAATEIGHVVWVKGTFSAGSRSLQRLSPIYLHDVLSTGANSMAEVAFTDNSLMTFKDNSSFSVDTYRFSKPAESNFTGKLVKGGFRTITGLIAKSNPSNYQINTPVATLGVRGTDYQAIFSGGYLYVAVYKGTVCIDVTNNTAPVVPAQCPSGLYSVISNQSTGNT
jgi:hypothetical protein